ncbi:DUF2808 domain-containing protein [Microcystis aeruginosa]
MHSPSIIPAGNIVLKGFEENSVHKHAAGIETYTHLTNYNLLPANKGVIWELPINLQIESIWVKTSTTLSASSKLDILINSVIVGTSFTSLISLLLEPKRIDTSNPWIAWEPPFCVIPAGLTVKAIANVDTETIYIAGKEVHLNPTIYPSIIES